MRISSPRQPRRCYPPITRRLVVRWTVGNVSIHGFEALSLSVRAAFALFGSEAEYLVCVNSISAAEVHQRLGTVPLHLQFRQVIAEEMPSWMRGLIDPAFAEGVAWKFAPVRIAPEAFELSLDNDVIFWRVPVALTEWLSLGEGCVIAEDVRPCFGKFAAFCGNQPRNSGIRGLPPGLNYEACLRSLLCENPTVMDSELDEQGLQIAALTRQRPTHVVRLSEVSICSPFPPHLAEAGSHGVHFVGLNAKSLPWSLNGVSAHEHIRANWFGKRAALERRVSDVESIARIGAVGEPSLGILSKGPTVNW
jgi:hypothetical protein